MILMECNHTIEINIECRIRIQEKERLITYFFLQSKQSTSITKRRLFYKIIYLCPKLTAISKISNNLVGQITYGQNDVFKTLRTERSYFSLKNRHTCHWNQRLWYVRKKLCDTGSSTARHKYCLHI